MTVSKERWHALSLADQLGNIGSEVGRARTWQGKDEKSFWGAVSRALELLDLTQADPRWKARRHEINRRRYKPYRPRAHFHCYACGSSVEIRRGRYIIHQTMTRYAINKRIILHRNGLASKDKYLLGEGKGRKSR